MEAISDGKAQELIDFIACGKDTDLLISSKLTRKEYYTRLSKLLKTDLVRRIRKRYVLTPFGEVIYEIRLRLAVAVNNRRKLRALDNLYGINIPANIRSKVMNEIIPIPRQIVNSNESHIKLKGQI